ncbi:Amino acid permease family protein [Tritrichomonas foetus]|uniref:Amino acid permease family protein n=1 Tax=Tritrichomonas foetus TaxID=1144522 RepID=A0A1J4KNX4_9EUKA|nr:Amino acid permease family protein [Tritrichomonas foetus]|eukprot:OHT12993.1 Amino acid permease family protein [Tritrichomonas foetus]
MIDQEESPGLELEEFTVLHPSPIDASEMAPSSLFYNSFGAMRPNIKNLRQGIVDPEVGKHNSRPKRPPPRFSTINGVYLRCIYNIISAVYYLRMGTVVAQCGLLLSMGMIVICAVITTVTTLCTAALVTNGKVKGGGIYYFISRSLGADWGGTVGVVFAFATTFNSVLQVFGFVEVVRWLIGKDITADGKWDIPIIGISLATVQVLSISLSLTFDFYFQNFMSVLIAISLVVIFFGFANPNSPKWLISNIKDNLYPDWRDGHDFFSVFSSFFPACCGIMAGSNISGDLKDPQKSIPAGTLGAIWTTTGIYLITAVILSSAAVRDVLHVDLNILMSISLWKPLCIAGCLGASISSSATALVDGPKLLQAICKDKIMPKFMDFFAVGKKDTDDPVRGFILAYVIVVICTFIFKDLNTVGIALTNFFLISYVLVCFSCIIGTVSRSPTWRPTWKFYHPAVAVFGFVLCTVAMFLMNWIFALCVIGITAILYCAFHLSQATTANWGSFTQALLYTEIVTNLKKLTGAPYHTKNFRPQVEYLILGKEDFDNQVRNIAPFKEVADVSHSLLSISLWGNNHDDSSENLPSCFIRRWKDLDLKTVATAIKQCGYGRMTPNMLSFYWQHKMISMPEIFDLVGAAFDANLSVSISRGFESLDTSLEHRWPIDVWWLLDDGGMTLLIAYLLSEHSVWKECKLRVFAIANKAEMLDQRQIKLQTLINQFRIPAEVIVITGIENDPRPETKEQWNNYELQKIQENEKKINSFLRLREMILDHSANSTIVIVSMPLPRLAIDPTFWLTMIDFVSDAMGPFMWIHGNNENVLTFTI